jgi:DNA helicase HerA-like ATPase
MGQSIINPDDANIDRREQDQLEAGIAYSEFHVFRQYMAKLSEYEVEPYPIIFDEQGKAIDEYSNIRLYRITHLALDKSENPTDKLASVYGAVHSIDSSLMLIIKSTADGIEFYVGVKKDPSSKLTAATAGMVLQSALKSNFAGTEILPVKNREAAELMGAIMDDRSNSVSSVAINPSLRDDDKDHFVQGLEKFMDAFGGKEYTAFLIAEPLNKFDVEMNKRGHEELYSALSHFADTTLAYGKNESKTITENMSRSFSEGVNNGVSRSNGGSQSHGTSHTDSWNSSSGYSGMFGNSSSGSGSSSGYSSNAGTNWSDSATSGTSRNDAETSGKSYGATTGESTNLTIKHTNKTVTRLLERIDEQLDKISSFESFGMWLCGAYFVSADIQTSIAAANTFRALVLGEETRTEAFVNIWDSGNMHAQNLLQHISVGQHPLIKLPEMNQYKAQSIKPTSLVSGKELPIFLGIPRSSLKGLIVNSTASFGRAVSSLHNDSDNDNDGDNDDDKIRFGRLGSVMHKGVVEENNSVDLNLEEFTSHCFITGSTGSGKSNATYCLLESFVRENIKFLVIEPKKGEYKFDFGNLPDVNIFWTNADRYSFLRINPFSFSDGIHVLEHMDRLIEIFSACWPLYNAMPAILKSATERSYTACGWDLLNSRRFDIGKPKFPTFDDLLRQLPQVINESDYSAQAKGDYIGSLVTRVSSLANGIMGQVFTSGVEIEDKTLFDQNTIIDLSRVGASETKSLIMGIIVMKLNEYRISRNSGMNSKLNHITVIEEAHNLLRRVSVEQSGDSANVAGKSVEMISNSIAEMRTYGEGFLIVDQSPTTVDLSAIKNTNTKIVMRLPERLDIETAGNAFSLNPEQIEEISRLPRGVAIVSQSGWVEPVMTKIDRADGNYKSSGDIEENDRKAVLMPFVNEVLKQTDDGIFDDKKIKDILGEKKTSIALSDEMLSLYRSFVSQSKSVVSNQQERASFVVRVFGCKALADVYLFKIDEEWGDARIVEEYESWKKKVYAALDEYALFSSTSEKLFVAKQLLIVKAYVENNADYIRLLRILKARG